MKKIIALALVAVLLSFAGCAHKEAEAPVGTTQPTTEPAPTEDMTPWDEPESVALPLDEAVAGELTESTTLYKLTVTEAGTFQPTFEIPAPGEGETAGIFSVRMYTKAEYRKDEQERVALWSRNVIGGSGGVNQLCRFRLGAGEYFLEVSGNLGACYTIHAGFTSEADKTDVEKEWNDTKSTATPISLNQKYTGNISWSDSSAYKDVDYYSFTLDEVTFVHLKAEISHFASYVFKLYDAQGECLMNGEAYCSAGKESQTCTWKSFRLEPGTYYVEVSLKGSSNNNTSIDYIFTAIKD